MRTNQEVRIGKKIIGVFTGILAIIAVVIAIALAGVRLFGLTPYAVLSGSMEPTYHVGSLIYDKNVETEELVVGDPITFLVADDEVVTHRIVEILKDDEGELWFRTKGDANETEDAELVHNKNVKGTPIFTVPKMGYVANFVSTFPGKYIMLAVVVLIIAVCVWPDEDDEGERLQNPEQE